MLLEKFRKSSREKSRDHSENKSRINRVRTLAALLVAGLSIPAFGGQSKPFPTYETGPQPNGSYVVSDGTIITPAGKQVNLGIQVRAKAIALNPTGNHTAAVLTLGAASAVQVFDTKTGALLGAHMIGAEVTEMIQGYAIARTLETTEAELMHTVFPPPTVSESMHESVLDAYGQVIHF